MKDIAEAMGLIDDHRNGILNNMIHDCGLLTECNDKRECRHLLKLINDRLKRVNAVTEIKDKLGEYYCP